MTNIVAPAKVSLFSGNRLASRARAVCARRLIVSIHDVAPVFEAETETLNALAERITGRPPAMLVVPDHWKGGAIRQGDAFARRLRDWAGGGTEIVLHGWSHRDEARHERRADRFRARHMTAGEGEFLGLSTEEARDRLKRGRDLLEDITGRPIRAFVAPAWLYGEGARAALGECGFALAEDHMRVWNPATGQRLAGGPVISWASRSPGRIASSLLFARAAPILLARQELVRIALHPGDAHVPSLMRSIERTLTHFAQRREAVRYADL